MDDVALRKALEEMEVGDSIFARASSLITVYVHDGTVTVTKVNHSTYKVLGRIKHDIDGYSAGELYATETLKDIIVSFFSLQISKDEAFLNELYKQRD